MDKWCPFYDECYHGNTCELALTNEVKGSFSNTDIETYEQDFSIIENNNNG